MWGKFLENFIMPFFTESQILLGLAGTFGDHVVQLSCSAPLTVREIAVAAKPNETTSGRSREVWIEQAWQASVLSPCRLGTKLMACYWQWLCSITGPRGYKSVLAAASHLQMFEGGFQEYLLHHLPGVRDEADQPLVPLSSCLPFLKVGVTSLFSTVQDSPWSP